MQSFLQSNLIISKLTQYANNAINKFDKPIIISHLIKLYLLIKKKFERDIAGFFSKHD